MLRRVVLVLAISGLCAGCDQVTKGIAKEGLDRVRMVSYLGDLVRLQYAENHGGMLSFGASLPSHHRFLILTVFVAIALMGFFLFTIFTQRLTHLQIIAMSLMLGGGLGNLIDRLWNDGAVIDFLVIGIGSIRTAVFNIADVAILFGAIVLLFSRSKPEADTQHEVFPEPDSPETERLNQ